MNKVKLFVILGLIIAGINCQNLGEANQCAKTRLSDKLPTVKEDCWSDKNDATKNCCFISATNSGLSFNMCALIPKGTDVTQVQTAIKSFGAEATIYCSSNILKFSIWLLIFLILNSL